VWDTVGSLGIPAYVKGARADFFRFVDTALSSKVRRGFHAMSLDELRKDFPVTRWNERDGIEQMWFVGAHADVGGGYAPHDSRLSDIALDWMTSNLAGLGVKFTESSAYKPNFGTPEMQAIHTPWAAPPFDQLGRSPRSPVRSDNFHPSVKQRWNADSAYRPEALAGIW
jgi:hypothetical protein